MTPLRHIQTLMAIVLASLLALPSQAEQSNPIYDITTNLGVITIELLPEDSPKTVENFQRLADEGFYDGLIFHRVIAGFMIQTGGFLPDMEWRRIEGTTVNESLNGPRNKKGTVAMARLSDPDSATSQFFINVKNNKFLDPKRGQPGYTVFGRVIDGMSVVEEIELSDTHVKAAMPDVPETPIIVESIRARTDATLLESALESSDNATGAAKASEKQ